MPPQCFFYIWKLKLEINIFFNLNLDLCLNLGLKVDFVIDWNIRIFSRFKSSTNFTGVLNLLTDFNS